MLPLVSLTLFLPLVGAVLILCLPKPATRTVHVIAIITAALTLIGALSMWFQGASGAGFSQVEELEWMPAIGAAYRVGVDGISLPLVLLSAVLFLVSFIYTSSLRDRPRAYVALILLLETTAIGTFTALDGILFYVFFEVSLVSMYFMIAGWGHEDRQRAALMFFIYTLLGSLPLLLAILGLYLGSPAPTFDMRAWIASPPLEGAAAMWALVAMLITFAVTAITVRLPPLSRINDDTPKEEVPVARGQRLTRAWQESLGAAERAPGLGRSVAINLKEGMLMTMSILPSILSVGLLGLLLAKYTPVFEWLGLVFYPLIALFGIDEASQLAQAAASGLAEMFLPALLMADTGLPARFAAGVISVSSILFFSASIPCILSTTIPLSIGRIVVIWLIRTLLSLALAIPAGYFAAWLVG